MASASLQGAVLDTEDPAVAEALGDLVDGLAEVKVSGELLPDGRLDVKFGFGVSVVLDGMDCLTFEGRTVGEPGALCLAEPLELDFSGCSVRISHERVGLLSRLAAVRIQAVRLHPDGSVSFDSGGSRLVRTGLQRAGEQFSSFLKRSPRLRPFLAKA